MPLSEPAAVVLTERFQRKLATISARTARAAVQAWKQLGAWNRADIARFAEATAPTFNAAAAATTNTAAAFYALIGDRPVHVPRATTAAAAENPFHAHWHALNEGRAWDEALAAGAAKAEAIAVDLVTGTSREVAALTADVGVVGWRRVLTGGEDCPWCATAATQRYRTAASATFGHDHCDCIVVPIFAAADPGQVINARHLTEVTDLVPGVRV